MTQLHSWMTCFEVSKIIWCFGPVCHDQNHKEPDNTKFLMHKNNGIEASNISRFRLMSPATTQTNNKYPMQECRAFKHSMSEAGFSSIEEKKRDNSSRTALIFQKQPYNKLGKQ